MHFSQCSIKQIDVDENNYKIYLSTDSDHGSSGGLLINSIDFKVIGIHKLDSMKINGNQL